MPALALSPPLAPSWQPGGWIHRLVLLVVMLAGTSACTGLPSQVDRPVSTALSTPGQTALGRLASARREQAGTPHDSAFHLLGSVESAFSSRLALIEAAARTLDLQYYAIHADASTELLLRRLRHAAQRGIRVRILLDDFNTVGRHAQVLRLAFEPNVEIRLFNPLPGSRASLVPRILASLHDFERLQKRMHNKLFIADNAWGITGGRNLADAYFGGGERSNFVDLDVLAAGRVVADMSSSFDRYWNDELAYPVQSLLSPADLDRLREDADPPRDDPAQPHLVASDRTVAVPDGAVLPGIAPGALEDARQAPLDLRRVPLTWAPSLLLVDKPGKLAAEDPAAGETVVDGLLGLMGQAREEVLIVSPYFVPGAQMKNTFAQLLARGVAVRVLTNSLASNDAPAAHAGYARHRPSLLRMGLELHEMRADPATAAASQPAAARRASGFALAGSGAGGSQGESSRASLHSKAVIIDRRLLVIGSMNLDLRSQLQNSEIALLIRSAALSQQVAQTIESTFATGAWRVVLEDGGLLWRAPPGAAFGDSRCEPEAGPWRRLLVKVLGPFAPDAML